MSIKYLVMCLFCYQHHFKVKQIEPKSHFTAIYPSPFVSYRQSLLNGLKSLAEKLVTMEKRTSTI